MLGILKQIVFDKRLLIGLVLVVGVALSFWTGSRYPDLNEKSMLGAERDLQGIAFDVVLPVENDDPLWKRIAFTTVNWMSTNKKGMAFGLVFGAALVTVLGFFDRRGEGGLFGNTFKGFLIGAPMGLCVNCAAPVAFGLKKSGVKPETALGAMLSSPAMNVIVIGMMFSLLPWYLAALKLVFSAFLIFVFVPLLVRYSPTAWMTPKTEAADACRIDNLCTFEPESAPPAGWIESFGWTAKNFFKNLWRLVRQTVPLMILAGFLGSAMITLLPFEIVERISDLGKSNAHFFILAGLAVIGVFLPVPMAFDVVMVVMLMGLGVPVSFAAVLLLTLGSYSIYSYLIVAKAFSVPTASILTSAVAVAAIIAGLVAPQLKEFDRGLHNRFFMLYFKQSRPLQRDIPVTPPAKPWSEIARGIAEHARAAEPMTGFTNTSPEGGSVNLAALPFTPRRASGETLFQRHPAARYGFELPSYFSIRKFVIYHHSFVRGLSSGDIHGDDWPDVLVCGDADIGGLLLFANIGGRGFLRQELDLGRLNGTAVLTAALVDLTNDGWLDIVFTTLDDGNWLYVNQGGRFLPGGLHLLSRKPDTSAVGIGFSDFDRNGWLDMFIGNYSIGHVAEQFFISHEISRNQLLFVLGPGPGNWHLADMPAMPGETHGILATDFNADSVNDFMVYNDWEVPDMLYLGTTNNAFRKAGREPGVPKLITRTTMAIQAADIDNDLDQEYLFTEESQAQNVAGRNNIRITLDEYVKAAPPEERELIATFRRKFRVFKNQNTMLTYYFIPEELRQDWLAYHTLRYASRSPDLDYTEVTPEHRQDVLMMLKRIATPAKGVPKVEPIDELPQTHEKENIFLVRDENGELVDRAKEYGIHRAGWTWHTGFADVDHDEYQDLYIVNGWEANDHRDNNTFFHNREGKKFELQTDEFGLTDYAATSAFNYVDFDRDGDLDILSLPVAFAPMRLFENQGTNGNSVTIQLRDLRGNRFGIGSRIVIHYGPDGVKHQMREIRASGGFISFEPQEAHFGLADHDRISAIEIRWPDGKETRLQGDFPVNRAYRLQREAE